MCSGNRAIRIEAENRTRQMKTHNGNGASGVSLLSAEQVAELTGLALDTLAQWRSQRRGIPYLKVGRAVRYDLNDVQAYLRGCRVSVSDPNERRHE